MVFNILAEELAKNRYAENIGEAALYALLGFITVFLGIAFLIFVIWGVGKVIDKVNGMQAKQTEKAAQPEKAAVALSSSENDEINDEVIAVITAAIAAYYQKENKKCEFTVKRIKRI